jgi:hypothetical protein
MAEWTVVYKSPISSRSEIVKGVLTDRGIEAVIINKKDSSIHINHGQIEVRVSKEQVLEAIKIVNDEISFS